MSRPRTPICWPSATRHLRAELAWVREHDNGVRLHAGIGYVTPNDEHHGRGEQIRKAREAGLEQAGLRQIAYHRANHIPEPHRPPRARPVRGAGRGWLIDPGSLSRSQKQVTSAWERSGDCGFPDAPAAGADPK